MIQQIFINLPIKELARSTRFFGALGFSFNPQFTNESATGMVLGENMYAMLLTEPFFKTFLVKPQADAHQVTAVLVAMSVKDRAAVDTMVDRAVAEGGKEPRPAQDHGWMYIRCFEDLDGHTWEVTSMDASAMPAA